MGGGLIQLALKGNDNKFLTDNPQITYFKKIYKRYTNFSTEPVQQNFNTPANFGSRVTCTISKTGDLINKMYLVVTLPSIPKLEAPGVCKWVKNIGFALIKSIELEIGGILVDKHYGDWLYIYFELLKYRNDIGLDKMIGNVPELIEFSDSKNSYRLYIPLIFYFCKDYGLALPVVALEKTEVKIHIEFSNIEDCIILAPSHYAKIKEVIVVEKKYDMLYTNINGSKNYIQYINYDNITSTFDNYIYYLKTNNSSNAKIIKGNEIIGNNPYSRYNVLADENLYYNANTVFNSVLNVVIPESYLIVDYVYLDTQERINFVKNDLEYIIEVLQYDNEKIVFNTNNKIKIGYTNLVKEIFVRGTLDYLTSSNSAYWRDKFNYTNSWDIKNYNSGLITNMKLNLNSNEREAQYPNYFYNYIQSYEHHNNMAPNGVFIYSFALNPFNSQPSGTCNFSKIDDITLQITLNNSVNYSSGAKIRIYALSYNILRFKNGIVDLVFNK
jgi:hypothetical protein